MIFYKYLVVFAVLSSCFVAVSKSTDTVRQLTSEDVIKLQKKSFSKYFNTKHNLIKLDQVQTVSADNIRKTFQMQNNIIPFTYNNRVKELIELYLFKYPDFTYSAFINYNLKEYEDAFKTFHMPRELRLLPIALSGNNPFYKTNESFKGIWQLDYFIAKMNGAIIDSLQDERLDPTTSSYVAASHFFGLYNEMKDIRAAVYALTCGVADVNKALEDAGGSSIELYKYLPEPKNDIFNLLSALYYIEINFHKFFHKKTEFINPVPDTLKVETDLLFFTISKFTGVDSLQLKKLNPKYYNKIIPGKNKPARLILHKANAEIYVDLRDSIYKYNDSLIKKLPKKSKNITKKKVVQSNLTEVYYTVKSGDSPGYISEWFDVGLSDLRRWNNIRGNLIRAGQTLVIYIPSNKADYYRQYDQLSYNEKQRREGYAVQPRNTTTVQLQDGEYLIYVVQKGDNPWLIAKKFPGVSDKDILKWNNIRARDLKPGQKLKIKKQ